MILPSWQLKVAGRSSECRELSERNGTLHVTVQCATRPGHTGKRSICGFLWKVTAGAVAYQLRSEWSNEAMQRLLRKDTATGEKRLVHVACRVEIFHGLPCACVPMVETKGGGELIPITAM